uniref:Double-stranded RNA-binding protein Staufen homolog 2 n=1 Tax=Tetraodon nigroviridis TaxID=99883 RepID=H3CRX3_TETNG
NMANPKEKTPMCLVNELARFNRIQPQYKLLSERGPAHAKVGSSPAAWADLSFILSVCLSVGWESSRHIFTVQLALGEQVWEAEGTSIKKAQHSTAARALEESVLPRPAPRSPKVDINSNPGSITPTVELNGLAMKRGEPAIYRPLDPKPMPNYRANYNFRDIAYSPFLFRYHYPVPKIFFVQLSVGSYEFIGEGRTRQAARHSAAMKALQTLRNEPIPERPPQNTEEKGESDDSSDASKSEISLVYEIALKRNLCVNFEVLKESGPPHMKSFLTRVTVGEFSAEGEGNSKKLSKKRAAISILQDLKKLPIIPAVEKPKLHYKKRTKTILKTGPDYGQGMNPISRLAQIQQAKKEKEPEYVLLSERGMPRRREFIMQVKVNNEVATGTGPNKKVAKRNARRRRTQMTGTQEPTSLLPPLLSTSMQMDNKGWNGQKASFTEATSNSEYQERNHNNEMVCRSCAHPNSQLLKGLLHLSPDIYQEMEASRKRHPPYYSGSASSPSPTATMARELLLNGQSPTIDASLAMKGANPGLACGVSVQPAQQLDYLARIQGFQVRAKTMPENNRREL